jgi:hypothetical protein
MMWSCPSPVTLFGSIPTIRFNSPQKGALASSVLLAFRFSKVGVHYWRSSHPTPPV